MGEAFAQKSEMTVLRQTTSQRRYITKQSAKKFKEKDGEKPRVRLFCILCAVTIESSGDSYYEGDRISRTGMSIHDATALCAGMTFENTMPTAYSVGARQTRAWKSANSRGL